MQYHVSLWVLFTSLIVTAAACQHPTPQFGLVAAPLRSCIGNACTEAGQSCENIDGALLCVYKCPSLVVSEVGKICQPDQFAYRQHDAATCACVPRNPQGRACTEDVECGYSPDEVVTVGVTQAFLCARPEGPDVCLAVGTACASNVDCDTGLCDVNTRLCDGACNAAFGQACGCGGTTQCDGTCSANCPVDPVGTGCKPGESEYCENECPGTRFCDANRNWGDCQENSARCPAGWSWDGGQCVWVSSDQGSAVTYYVHRAKNETMAATGPIGTPVAGGVSGPLYVEATLAQWSDKDRVANHCGKGNHVSAWIGCVRPDGSLGYGRDTADHEWESKVMIPLRCEPGDTIGVFKHSWGHDAHWHCARQLQLGVVRNHDPIGTCTW